MIPMQLCTFSHRSPLLAPDGGALQQPSEVLVHDKRDAGAWKDANEVGAESAIKPGDTLVRPGVHDRRRDRTMMCTREQRVVLCAKKKNGTKKKAFFFLFDWFSFE
jgi:hypothetical protein